MSGKKIAIGSVTKGFNLKSSISNHLNQQGHDVLDVGCFDTGSFVKYTTIGEAIAYALHNGDAEFGMIFCNFGTSGCAGVAKFRGVCAFNCESVQTAEAARKVNGANVLCMGASLMSIEMACRIVDAFIHAEFLDLPGVPHHVQQFRRQARDQLIASGEIPRTTELT